MIRFIIKYWRYITPVITILGVLGAFLYYGHTEFNKGYDKGVSDYNLAENKTRKSDAQIWNEVRHENAKITDLDTAGLALGILRADDNR